MTLCSMAGATILDIMYGMDIQSASDRNLEVVEKAVHILVLTANAGAYLGQSNLHVGSHRLMFCQSIHYQSVSNIFTNK